MSDGRISWPDLMLPPINLNVLQSAYNFYSDDEFPEDEAPPNGGLEDED